MLIRSLAVFCGSKDGRDALFTAEARSLGVWMASRSMKLVYGGGNVGLMGAVANAVMENGGSVVGVIPEILDARERSHKTITELLIVGDMHIRKEKCMSSVMQRLFCPGYGTLDELFEMITWNNLSIHDKNIYIINLNGFYNHLLAHIETMLHNGFLYENPMHRLTVVGSVEELVLLPEFS